MYTKVQTSSAEPPVQQPAIDQPQHSAPRLRARNLRRGTVSAAGLATLTLVLAACGGGPSAYGSGGYGAAPATPSAAGTAATVDLHDSKLGQILVDAQGRTLYLFEADTAGKSNCHGACTTAWPPYLSSGTPRPGWARPPAGRHHPGRRQRPGDLSRSPLYYFAGDSEPGDPTGKG